RERKIADVGSRRADGDRNAKAAGLAEEADEAGSVGPGYGAVSRAGESAARAAQFGGFPHRGEGRDLIADLVDGDLHPLVAEGIERSGKRRRCVLRVGCSIDATTVKGIDADQKIVRSAGLELDIGYAQASASE